jgi:hypothetical protein
VGKGTAATAHRGWFRRILGRRPALVVVALGASASAIGPGWAARASDRAVQPSLHVIPFPGTPDASPTSEIIFLSLRPSDLLSVTVRGSRSGRHAGLVSALPGPIGTSFTPTRPFTPGEQVAITAALSSSQAGTDSGDPGASRLRFSFTVGVSGDAGAQADPRGSGRAAVRHSARRPSELPVERFHSRPDLRPPAMLAGPDPDRSGDIFLTDQIGSYRAGEPLHGGPMILDSRGRLIWFRPLRHQIATNLEVQRYLGRPVLTWWQGKLAFDSGRDVIMSDAYRPVATVRGAEGYRLDLHEFQLTPQGDALVDAYQPVQASLASVGGLRHGYVMDCIIQEIDIRTGRLLWEWHALGHVPLTDSFLAAPQGTAPYDFFHLNSIQQLPGDRLLVSARSTWAVYEIDQRTGRIIWRLGGRRPSFTMGPGTRFEWQHDARMNGHTLSLFDDASNGPEAQESESSAKVLRIDTRRMTVTSAGRYTHSPPLLSVGAGSTQVLPDGNVFVGWGSQPEFSEYSPSGRQIFDASFPLGMASFRAYRFPWIGQPIRPPALAVVRSRRGITAYASWNGATQVAGWRVLGGPRVDHLAVIGHRRRTGFETAVRLRHASRYAQVEALNPQGRVLGRSRLTTVPGPQ